VTGDSGHVGHEQVLWSVELYPTLPGRAEQRLQLVDNRIKAELAESSFSRAANTVRDLFAEESYGRPISCGPLSSHNDPGEL
jgi:hypothetical protein